MLSENRWPTAKVVASVARPSSVDRISQRRSQWLRDAGAITSRVKMPTNISASRG
jgi:hypothetical protein